METGVTVRRATILALFVALAWTAPAGATPPPNDDIAFATEITTLPFQVEQDTSGATHSAGEPSCDDARKSVWYRFTPSEDTAVYLTRQGSTHFGRIDVFRLDGQTYTPVECFRMVGIEISLQGGKTYFFRLTAAPGRTLFRALAFDAPTNDDFDDAIEIPSLPVLDPIAAGVATAAPDDPLCAPAWAAPVPSVWYRFTPAKTVKLDLPPSSWVWVFTGARGALVPVKCRREVYDLVLEGGTTYHVMVAVATSGIGTVFAMDSTPFLTKLTTNLNKWRVPYRGTVRVKVRLHGAADPDNRQVLLYAQPRGQRARLVARGTMNRSGVYYRFVRPRRATTYWATYAGDGRHYGARSDGTGIAVYAGVRTRLVEFYGRSGADKLYRSSPVVVATVQPRMPRRRASLEFQRDVGKPRWQHVGWINLRLGPNSAAGVRVIGLGAGRYRVRTYFGDSRNHLTTKSPWVTFRVTG